MYNGEVRANKPFFTFKTMNIIHIFTQNLFSFITIDIQTNY